jgi:hypothetical protein
VALQMGCQANVVVLLWHITLLLQHITTLLFPTASTPGRACPGFAGQGNPKLEAETSTLNFQEHQEMDFQGATSTTADEPQDCQVQSLALCQSWQEKSQAPVLSCQ